ncbi:TPM domain-containing protein [bacterium]|nr:TPM domain-containing protein [bacterium]
MKNKLFIILFIVFGIFSFLYAENYPNHTDDYINDFAKVLNQTDYDAVHKMLSDLEYSTGIELVVVTINSIYDYDTNDLNIESFAKNLFNHWGVGHKKENNGVMLLVAIENRKMRIQLGGGYPKMYDKIMQGVIDNNIIPYFKNNEYSRGISEGCRGIIEKITKKVSWFAFYKWHIILGILFLVFLFAGINFLKQGKKGWGWVLLSIAGIILIILIKMLLSGKSKSGFGGGSSFGGGATGSW